MIHAEINMMKYYLISVDSFGGRYQLKDSLTIVLSQIVAMNF